MCGIVGIASRETVDATRLRSATAALRHRGPDTCGIYIEANHRIGFGHTRLSIIDLSSGGDQPMKAADGQIVITFNGEIYNYRELRRDFANSGYVFKTQSDTEVLLAGYLLHGTKILEKLNGIFAFAIHDRRTAEVFVARDQMGVKPLYYASTSSGLAFASEIKALLEVVEIERTLDLSALRRYMTFLWCPGEQTLFKHVKRLAPGTAFIVKDGSVAQMWTYWKPPAYAPRANWSMQDCATELNELLGTCVARQMVSDAPLGAFLSGGVDSSAIVAKARTLNSDIECFTIKISGTAETGSVSDLPYARAVAAHLGVKLTEVEVDAQAMCERVVDMVSILDEPLADPACLNVLFISELARSHGIKVLLSGVGGDDLFTGYRRHTVLGLDAIWQAVPSPVRRGLVRAASKFDRRRGWTRKLARMLELAAENGDRRIISSFLWGKGEDINELLAPDLRSALSDEDVAGPLAGLLGSAAAIPLVEKCLMLEKRFFLADHNLIYTDKMGMAAGVEIRVPFLDLELVKFAAQVPISLKMALLRPKRALKRSQSSLLPANIIHRPKAGFGAPLRRWMRSGMQDLVDDLLSRATIHKRGLFDACAVQRLLDRDRRGEVDASYTLFSLICVELWCRRFIDSAVHG